ncbi:MAG TPA: CsbD family protein [Bryobacteraceae bacterium]|nr:CsbD family protein [Bryobacteraceae bacterium]
MDDSTKDRAEGAAHELKGNVKEKLGRAVGNPDLEDEGTGEKIAGKVQQKIGDIEKVFEK